MAKAFRVSNGTFYVQGEFSALIDRETSKRIYEHAAQIGQEVEGTLHYYPRISFIYDLSDDVVEPISAAFADAAPDTSLDLVTALFAQTVWGADGAVISIDGFALCEGEDGSMALVRVYYEA